MLETGKIMACVDQSHFADDVTDAAAWAAARLGAPMELLHVIDRHPERGSGEDHSGAIGIDAQESLLTQLSESEADRSRALREQGRKFLHRLRERAREKGLAHVDMRQRYGQLEETLLEQQAGVGLVVLGRRGESAESTGRDLGRNVERVVRALSQPILAVTEGFVPPERLLIAFDGSAVTRRGVELVAQSPLFAGLAVTVLTSGKPARDAEKKLEWAERTLTDSGLPCAAILKPGDPEANIAQAIRERDIQLLVMGAFGHSPLRSMLLGSRTAELLRASRIPTLMLR
mgnify:FL=1